MHFDQNQGKPNKLLVSRTPCTRMHQGVLRDERLYSNHPFTPIDEVATFVHSSNLSLEQRQLGFLIVADVNGGTFIDQSVQQRCGATSIERAGQEVVEIGTH